MKLQELLVRAQAGQVDSLELISLEGGTYVLEAVTGGHPVSVKDANGVVLHLRSVEHARDLQLKKGFQLMFAQGADAPK